MQDGPRPGALARVPPNNLRAEESVLGAMLLSREAIAEVVEVLEPDHFYKPAHGHLYDAILSLYSGGEPVDAVTVADELKRAGLLDEVGGPAVLLDFQATTPAISNAAHYAKIVEEHALLRRMIAVSNEIAETAYGIPDDVVKAVDDAEAQMFDVAQRRVANTMAPIKDLLPANLDRIEMLYDRGEAITGLSTGYLDLDEKLAGLQPSALYVVGARPAMGKALATDTPIVTVDGWSTMGRLRVGDTVFDEQGQPTSVTYKSPVFVDHDCYEVVFDDGTVIVADGEHQWLTWDDRAWTSVAARWDAPVAPPTVRTTAEIAATATVAEGGHPNHRIPVSGALDHPEVDLPIDPYRLGVRLGERGGQADGGRSEGPLLPAVYRRAAPKQRLAVLQGWMDAAGSVMADRETCELTLSDEHLLDEARQLVLSLGFKAHPIQQRTSDHGTEGWRFAFSPSEPVFRLEVGRRAQRVVDRPTSRSRWRAITEVRPIDPVPTQCITVDSSNHLYLAGRELVPTHNTAFALGLAANSAMKDDRPVLIFTLEMSQLELSQRLLCSEALVDAGRVKTGRLEEGEWSRISHAVGRLAEAPIYIDDNPHTSVMDIRAKARRLKSRAGDLGMVVVDYIQLMTGRSTAESRQVEVSEISRNLKILARELDAPVVALAQLNRGLEQRQDKRPMLSDLRESGCMPASTRILLANGTEMTMGELLCSQETPDVWAIDRRGRMVPRRLVKTFSSGVKPVYRMTFASGRTVEATGNHRFKTIDGWEPLEALSPGDRLAVPRRIPEPPEPVSWPDDQVIDQARLLREGSADPRPATDPAIPDEVHGLATRQVALFLRTLWTADRPVTSSGERKPTAPCSYPTTSRPIALGVQRLLQRFAIRSEVAAAPGGDRHGYHVRVQGRRDLGRLLELVGGDDDRREQTLMATHPLADQGPDSCSDIEWDELVDVVALGEQPVFDATIETDHNFIANGIVAHNSLEQDADVVLFLYRDEIYDEASPDKGVAEVIIAKHRNGPTGKARLAFRGQYTRFDNMARSIPPGGGSSKPDGGGDSVDF